MRPVLACCGGLILLLSLAACEVPEQQGAAQLAAGLPVGAGQPLMEQAEIAHALGDYVRARQLFSELVAREPTNLAAAIGLGETLLALGEPDEAAIPLTRVAQESLGGRQKARAQFGLGLVHLRKGERGKAETLLELSSNGDPGAWRTLAALGQVYDRQKKFAAARRVFARAENAAPGEAVVLNDTGMSLLAEGKPAEAIGYFRRAIALDPELAIARSNIRLAHAKNRGYAEAVAGASDEEMPAILNNVGYIAILNGDYESAETFLQDSIRLSPYYNTTALANMQFLESMRRRGAG